MNKQPMNTLDLTDAVIQTISALQNDRKIFGIRGLAEYLKCSDPTAGRIAASGRFPRYQVSGTRKIFFFEREILQAIRQ